MRAGRRIHLDQVLGDSLPDWVPEAEGHGRGHWHTAVGEAGWELEPTDSGFWLLLRASLDLQRTSRSPLAQAGEWPWPLKPVRREPGAGFLWSAEIRLDGEPGETQRVQELVQILEAWLPVTESERETSRGRSLEGVDSYPLPEDEQLIVRALGSSLKRTAQGFRLPCQDCPALVISASAEGFVLRATLVREPNSLVSGALAALDDFLAVANGRLRGCRAFREVQGSNAAALLEARVARDLLTVNSLRAVGDTLQRSARQLAPACQIMVQQPVVGERYRELLIGESVETTEE